MDFFIDFFKNSKSVKNFGIFKKKKDYCEFCKISLKISPDKFEVKTLPNSLNISFESSEEHLDLDFFDFRLESNLNLSFLKSRNNQNFEFPENISSLKHSENFLYELKYFVKLNKIHSRKYFETYIKVQNQWFKTEKYQLQKITTQDDFISSRENPIIFCSYQRNMIHSQILKQKNLDAKKNSFIKFQTDQKKTTYNQVLTQSYDFAIKNEEFGAKRKFTTFESPSIFNREETSLKKQKITLKTENNLVGNRLEPNENHSNNNFNFSEKKSDKKEIISDFYFVPKNFLKKIMYLGKDVVLDIDEDICKHKKLKPIYEDIFMKAKTRFDEEKSNKIDYSQKELFNSFFLNKLDNIENNLTIMKFLFESETVDKDLFEDIKNNNFFTQKNIKIENLNEIEKCLKCETRMKQFSKRRIFEKALVINLLKRRKDEKTFLVDKKWFYKYTAYLLSDIKDKTKSSYLFMTDFKKEKINERIIKKYDELKDLYKDEISFVKNEFVFLNKSLYQFLTGLYGVSENLALSEDNFIVFFENKEMEILFDIFKLNFEEKFVFNFLKKEFKSFSLDNFDSLLVLNEKINVFIKFKIYSDFDIFVNSKKKKKMCQLNSEKYIRKFLRIKKNYDNIKAEEEIDLNPCKLIFQIFSENDQILKKRRTSFLEQRQNNNMLKNQYGYRKTVLGLITKPKPSISRMRIKTLKENFNTGTEEEFMIDINIASIDKKQQKKIEKNYTVFSKKLNFGEIENNRNNEETNDNPTESDDDGFDLKLKDRYKTSILQNNYYQFDDKFKNNNSENSLDERNLESRDKSEKELHSFRDENLKIENKNREDQNINEETNFFTNNNDLVKKNHLEIIIEQDYESISKFESFNIEIINKSDNSLKKSKLLDSNFTSVNLTRKKDNISFNLQNNLLSNSEQKTEKTNLFQMDSESIKDFANDLKSCELSKLLKSFNNNLDSNLHSLENSAKRKKFDDVNLTIDKSVSFFVEKSKNENDIDSLNGVDCDDKNSIKSKSFKDNILNNTKRKFKNSFQKKNSKNKETCVSLLKNLFLNIKNEKEQEIEFLKNLAFKNTKYLISKSERYFFDLNLKLNLEKICGNYYKDTKDILIKNYLSNEKVHFVKPSKNVEDRFLDVFKKIFSKEFKSCFRYRDICKNKKIKKKIKLNQNFIVKQKIMKNFVNSSIFLEDENLHKKLISLNLFKKISFYKMKQKKSNLNNQDDVLLINKTE